MGKENQNKGKKTKGGTGEERKRNGGGAADRFRPSLVKAVSREFFFFFFF